MRTDGSHFDHPTSATHTRKKSSDISVKPQQLKVRNNEGQGLFLGLFQVTDVLEEAKDKSWEAEIARGVCGVV